MSSLSSTAMTYRPHLGPGEKTLTYVSWAGAGIIFFTVGWIAFEPVDPLGAVTLLSNRGVMAMLVQATAIAAVVAALVTVVAGRRLADVGTFAVALGMGLVALRGSTMEYMLLEWAERDNGSVGRLAAAMLVESFGWFAVMLVALLISGLVRRWAFRTEGYDGNRAHEATMPLPAAWDVPGLSRLVIGRDDVPTTHVIDGVKHTLIAALVTIVMYRILGAGLYERRIDHGQVCFVLAAAMCIGCSVACHLSPVRSALWSVLAVGIVAIVAYMIAAVTSGTEPPFPPNIPASHYLRTLPVQYIAVGAATAVLTFWWQWAPERFVEQE